MQSASKERLEREFETVSTTVVHRPRDPSGERKKDKGHVFLARVGGIEVVCWALNVGSEGGRDAAYPTEGGFVDTFVWLAIAVRAVEEGDVHLVPLLLAESPESLASVEAQLLLSGYVLSGSTEAERREKEAQARKCLERACRLGPSVQRWAEPRNWTRVEGGASTILRSLLSIPSGEGRLVGVCVRTGVWWAGEGNWVHVRLGAESSTTSPADISIGIRSRVAVSRDANGVWRAMVMAPFGSVAVESIVEAPFGSAVVEGDERIEEIIQVTERVRSYATACWLVRHALESRGVYGEETEAEHEVRARGLLDTAINLSPLSVVTRELLPWYEKKGVEELVRALTKARQLYGRDWDIGASPVASIPRGWPPGWAYGGVSRELETKTRIVPDPAALSSLLSSLGGVRERVWKEDH
jgi:hypothetical protein